MRKTGENFRIGLWSFLNTGVFKVTMRIIVCHFSLVLMLALIVGCGKNCAVSGKVTFSDGTPLTVGRVVFETPTFQATGKIQSDGTYKMGSSKPGDGVPKGDYRISIQEVMKPTKEFTGEGKPPKLVFPKTPPIDSKYFSANSSGLTCEVKGRTKYDITIEPPK